MGNCFGKKRKLTSDNKKDVKPADNCPICLDLFNNRALVNTCRHQFCFQCIKRWSQRHRCCPVCRQKYTSLLLKFKSDSDYCEYPIGQQITQKSSGNQRLQPLLMTINSFDNRNNGVQYTIKTPATGLVVIYQLSDQFSRVRYGFRPMIANRTYIISDYSSNIQFVSPEDVISIIARLTFQRNLNEMQRN